MIDNKMKNRQLFISYFLLGMLLLNMTSCSQYRDYRESLRRDNFNKNFDAFQKLEQMQRKDIKVFSISINDFKSFKRVKTNCPTFKNNNIEYESCYQFTSKLGITANRFNEYKRLLSQAGMVQLIYQHDKPNKRQVWFHAEGENDSGYVYMEYPPPKFFRKFSECEPIMPTHSCYVLLSKNWYMFQEWARLEQE